MSGQSESGGAEGGGIPGRIESAARTKVPDPKGKGVVTIILAVAVLIALIWDFSGRGGASRAAREAVEKDRATKGTEDDTPLAAPENPEDPADGSEADPAPRRMLDRPAPPRAGLIQVKIGPTQVTMPPAAAVAAWLETPAEEREALRLQMLEALLKLTRTGGRSASDAFDAAAWLIDGAGEDASEVILHLTNVTSSALSDDAAAPGALLFLSRIPDGVDKRMALSLDAIITDAGRPLRLRIAAARIRPKDGRPARVRELADDATTHPALRDALK